MSSISGMITSLKNNKRTRVSTFEKMKNFKEGKNIQVSFDKKSTPDRLKRIKEKLQSENKKLLKRNIIIIIVAISIIIYVIGFVKIL
jgi:Flp pilus assembly protein TadB